MVAETLYPGYNVLDKFDTVSWNAKTREVVTARLAVLEGAPRFFDPAEWAALNAACARIVPQPASHDGNGGPIPVAALVDQKLHENIQNGYRNAKLPPQREAWKRGLRALDAEARAAHNGAAFDALAAEQQDALLKRMESGDMHDPAWDGMPPKLFFEKHLLRDSVYAYYSHPTAWSEIGFGGPASPRGYVRLPANMLDPWEAIEARPGEDREQVAKENRRVG